MPIRISQDEAIELLKASGSFEQTADRLPDIIALFDKDLRHLFVNKTIERITGLSRQNYLGRTNRELGMPEDLCQIWDSAFRKSFDTGKTIEIEFEYTGAQFFQAKAVPQRDSAGNVETILVITRDITKLKQQQEAMVRSATNTSIQHLCAELSHHLNNPLAIMLAQLDLLKKKLNLDNNPQLRKAFKNLELSAGRIHETIQNISRITELATSESEKEQIFTIKEGLLMAQSLCRENRDFGHVEIDIKVDSQYRIQGSLADFVEASYQLLKNAVESASRAGQLWVRIQVECNEQTARIQFIDGGHLDRNEVDIKKMFLPFYTTKGPAVKGLGLSVAQDILRRMGGTVAFDQNAKETTFYFEIPIKQNK